MDNKGFKITSTRTENTNPVFKDFDAWKVRITNPRGKTFSTKFYQGSAFNGQKPELRRVLESLILDANVAMDISEEEFLEDLYFDDEEYGKKAYKNCININNRLELFLTHSERQYFGED